MIGAFSTLIIAKRNVFHSASGHSKVYYTGSPMNTILLLCNHNYELLLHNE